MRQVTRIVLAGSAGSPDRQDAVLDEAGGYGETMEEIDRVLADVLAEDPDRSDPSPSGPAAAA